MVCPCIFQLFKRDTALVIEFGGVLLHDVGKRIDTEDSVSDLTWFITTSQEVDLDAVFLLIALSSSEQRKNYSPLNYLLAGPRTDFIY